MSKGTKMRTPVGELTYVFIKGKGINQAMKGAEPSFKYKASILFPKGSEGHNELLKIINNEWEAYKVLKGLKGRPKTNGIKEEMKDDPSGAIDPDTEKIKKIPTGNVIATFKTNIAWPNGDDNIVGFYDGKGKDYTDQFHEAKWSVGNGSRGTIHGTAMANEVGGTPRVTLYLSAIQVTKLVKYEGSAIEAEELENAESLESEFDGVEPIEDIPPV